MNVRGFIRNVTKARENLGCIACDASDGVFVGDVTHPSSLIAPMVGVHSLMIATGAPLVCPDVTDFSKCYYPSGDLPIDAAPHSRRRRPVWLQRFPHSLALQFTNSSLGSDGNAVPLGSFRMSCKLSPGRSHGLKPLRVWRATSTKSRTVAAHNIRCEDCQAQGKRDPPHGFRGKENVYAKRH